MGLTLEQSLRVMNRRRHRDSSSWEVVPNLRGPKVYVRADGSSTSLSWLTEFEARAIAAGYLREEASSAEDSLGELTIFLCRGGKAVEQIGIYQRDGDRGPFQLMIAGDDGRAAEMRERARAQMRQGMMSDFRECRFVNAEEVEVIGRDWKVVE